jgi:hypothetical protein
MEEPVSDNAIMYEFMQQLGLLPWDVFRGIAIARNYERMQDQGDIWDSTFQEEVTTKGTGRTTRQMVFALIEVYRGQQVYFSADTAEQEDRMTAQTRDWLSHFGLMRSMCASYRRDRKRGPAAGNGKVRVIHDHPM